MNLIKFLTSKIFLKQLGLAVVVAIVLIFITMQWLKVSTNHGEYIDVPDLSKKSLNEVEQILDRAELRFVVQDSTNFNPKYPRFSVIEQNPTAGEKVKKDRKIYLVLNPSGYSKVTVPKVIQVTRRNAESIIRAVGLEVGEVTYVDNIGKDMVLAMKHKGSDLEPGDMLIKTSKIDLICGNGNKPGSAPDDENEDDSDGN